MKSNFPTSPVESPPQVIFVNYLISVTCTHSAFRALISLFYRERFLADRRIALEKGQWLNEWSQIKSYDQGYFGTKDDGNFGAAGQLIDGKKC